MENKEQLNHNIVNSTNRAVDLVSTFAMPQDITMTLKGNNLLATGAFIFIDATLGLGRRVAERLRLGGYYRITTVNQTFSPSGWTTDVAARCEIDSLNIANRIRKDEEA